jgi:hypothetical protein
LCDDHAIKRIPVEHWQLGEMNEGRFVDWQSRNLMADTLRW